MVRHNLIGDSMLAIPLLAQGIPFGVLSFLNERPRAAHEWNQRLAEGLAHGGCAGHLKCAAARSGTTAAAGVGDTPSTARASGRNLGS